MSRRGVPPPGAIVHHESPSGKDEDDYEAEVAQECIAEETREQAEQGEYLPPTDPWVRGYGDGRFRPISLGGRWEIGFTPEDDAFQDQPRALTFPEIVSLCDVLNVRDQVPEEKRAEAFFRLSRQLHDAEKNVQALREQADSWKQDADHWRDETMRHENGIGELKRELDKHQHAIVRLQERLAACEERCKAMARKALPPK